MEQTPEFILLISSCTLCECFLMRSCFPYGVSGCLHVCSEWQAVGVAHHVPDPQDDGSCADMAAQTAACGVPAVPRGDHHLVWFITTERAFRGDLGVRKRDGPRCPVRVRRASVHAEEWRTGTRLRLTCPLLITVSGLTARSGGHQASVGVKIPLPVSK